jgi:uncharacterized membrane protein
MVSFLRRTILSGLFVVLPVTLIVVVLTRAVGWLFTTLIPIATALPFAQQFPGRWALAWVLLPLLLACFIAGLILRLPLVRDFVTAARGSLTSRFPAYADLRGFEDSLLGKTGAKHVQAALVELDGALVPAFLAEELADGRRVVFVPTVPGVGRGTVYVLARGRVHLIDAPAGQVAQCVRRRGVGAGDLVKSIRKVA